MLILKNSSCKPSLTNSKTSVATKTCIHTLIWLFNTYLMKMCNPENKFPPLYQQTDSTFTSQNLGNGRQRLHKKKLPTSRAAQLISLSLPALPGDQYILHNHGFVSGFFDFLLRYFVEKYNLKHKNNMGKEVKTMYYVRKILCTNN